MKHSRNTRFFLPLAAFALCLASCDGVSALYEDKKVLAEDYDRWGMLVKEQELGADSYKGSLDDFGGMTTLWTFESGEPFSLEGSWSLAVSAGKAKIILISPAGDVATLAEAKAGEQASNDAWAESFPAGSYRIKLVGMARSKIDLSIRLNHGAFKTLGFK